MRGTLPPQAYTREVLAHAYTWLQAQPDTVKGMAQSPDALVSLYLRSKRNGDSLEQEAPVSSENFRSQLKTLASDLQQFAPPAEKPRASQQSFSLPPPVESASFASSESSHDGYSLGGFDLKEEPAPRKMGREMHKEMTREMHKEMTREPGLDRRSQEMVARVRHYLNLSSDSEALRMLIVLGYEKIQNGLRL